MITNFFFTVFGLEPKITEEKDGFTRIISDLYPPEGTWRSQWNEGTFCGKYQLSHKNPSLVIFTDASNQGWGAHTESWRKQIAGLWNPRKDAGTNLLEMRAVVLAPRHRKPYASNR